MVYSAGFCFRYRANNPTLYAIADAVNSLKADRAAIRVVIHFGELRPAFEATATALRDGGLLVFTLFPNDDDDSVAVLPLRGMAHGGCYVHGRRYIVREAEAAHFSVELLKDDIHEYQNDNPITGTIVALRRRPRASGSE